MVCYACYTTTITVCLKEFAYIQCKDILRGVLTAVRTSKIFT